MSWLRLQAGIQTELGAFCVQKKDTLQAVKDFKLCPWPL